MKDLILFEDFNLINAGITQFINSCNKKNYKPTKQQLDAYLIWFLTSNGSGCSTVCESVIDSYNIEFSDTADNEIYESILLEKGSSEDNVVLNKFMEIIKFLFKAKKVRNLVKQGYQPILQSEHAKANQVNNIRKHSGASSKTITDTKAVFRDREDTLASKLKIVKEKIKDLIDGNSYLEKVETNEIYKLKLQTFIRW